MAVSRLGSRFPLRHVAAELYGLLVSNLQIPLFFKGRKRKHVKAKWAACRPAAPSAAAPPRPTLHLHMINLPTGAARRKIPGMEEPHVSS